VTQIATVPLGEIADLQAGVGFPPDLQGRPSGDYPLAKVGDISRLGRTGASVLNTADHFVDEADLARLKAKPIPAGSVLFAKIGEAIRQNHRVIAGCELLVDNNAMAAIPTERVESRYLFHFLRTVDFYVLASATTVPALRKSDLQRLPVPLPPLPEQRRIAEILDKADALRATRRAALAQLDILTQSIFLDMFGDPTTNPKGWPATTLGDALIAIRNGANAEQREEPGGWPITRIETISDGTINPERVRWIEPDESLIENFQLEPGDILFSHINSVEHIGKTALYSGTPTPLIHGINLLRLRPNVEFVDPVWLLHLLKHDFVRTHFRTRCKRAVNQASLNQPDIKSVRTFLPPLSLQHAFARRVAALQSLECAHRASLAAQDSLFASLQQRAFQGEL